MTIESGLAAVSTDHGVRLSVDTDAHGHADDDRLDHWELEASRRALGNLRTLLYGQPMLDLIGEQLDEHDKVFRGYWEASDDQWSECHVTLQASGITLGQALPAIAESMAAMGEGVDGGFDAKRDAVESVIFPIHPEHYSVMEGLGGIETMGGIPCRNMLFRVPPEDVPDWIAQLKDPSYAVSNVGRSELVDGTPHTWTLQQMKDTADGVEFDLRVWYPAACPPAYVEEHAQHFPIEVRGLLRLAAARVEAEATEGAVS
jgi:hypothetical protein